MTENTLAPVDLGTAQRIDSALRAQTRTVAGAMADWRPLIEEARDKGIYEVLGFTTWPAYIADVIHSHMGALLPADRLQVVEVLSREGMSQRAIAEALDVNQATISRDQKQLMHDASVDGASAEDPSAAPLPPKVTGLDGKQRRRPVPASQPIAVTKSEKVVGGGSIIVDPVSVPVPEVDSHVALVDLDAETRMQAPISGPQKPAEAQNQAKTDKQYEEADHKAQRAAWMSDNEELTERNAELAKTNAELTKKIAKARENLGAACKQVAELKAELSACDQLIAELREELKLAKAKSSPFNAPAPTDPVERVADGIVRYLVGCGGRANWSDVRTNAISGPDRKHFEAAVERLVTARTVEVITVGRGKVLALLAEQIDTGKAS